MRRLRYHLLYLLLLLVLAANADAQVINCGSIGESPNDTVRVVSSEAAIGDTALVPISIKNIIGIASFQLYLEYDSTLLKPIVIGSDIFYDSLGNPIAEQFYYDHFATGRYLQTEIKLDEFGFPYLDTTTFVQLVSEPDFESPDPDRDRMKILGLIEDIFSPEVVIEAGEGLILYVPFEVSPTATVDELSWLSFYTDSILFYDTEPPFDVVRKDCVYSRYTDEEGDVGSDVRLTTWDGVVRAVEEVIGDPPTVNSFTATPNSIQEGGSSTLSWDVTDADVITIDNGIGEVSGATGSIVVSPTETTTYRLTAENFHGSASGVATVTVGSSTGNNEPIVQSVPGAPFTVNQGQSLAFSVSATDPDAGDIITLSAVSLPPNATFNQAVGTNSVSGDFAFSPDFTQSGVFSAVFQATDNQGGISNQLTILITVIEITSDRLFTTSLEGDRPVGGLAGKQGIYLPINFVTAQTVYGVQFDFFYDAVLFDIDSFVTTGRTADYTVYDNIGATPGEVRVLTFGLQNEPIVNVADTTAILYAVMSITNGALPGDYPIYIENGWESVNPDPDFPALELDTDSGIIQVDLPGDVNADKGINVGDIVNIVAYIINAHTLSDRQFDAADVIIDDAVNVFDLVAVINLIYGLPVSPAPPVLFGDDKANVYLTFDDMSQGQSTDIQVQTELPTDIAGVEMVIEYDPTSLSLGEPIKSTDASQMQMFYSDDNSGRMKLLMHFKNPYLREQLIQEGLSGLIDIPAQALDDVSSGDHGKIRISEAFLSTADAEQVEVGNIEPPPPLLPDDFALSQNYPNPFNPYTTIEFNLAQTSDVKLDIFNILGQQVRTLVNGVRSSGPHFVEWNSCDDAGELVASGIYLYRLKVGSATKTKKMVFLK